jgi:APA family basic amino acid/polyamine antiporter
LAGYGVTVGEELAQFIGPQFHLPIAIALIILLVSVNTLGSKTAANIQVVSTICKLIPLFLLMIFGFILGSGENPIFTPMVGENKNPGAVLGSTLLAVLFAFEGWTNVGAIAGEMKNPGKDMPLAIVGGVSIIMAVYFVINMAYLWVLPAEELMNISSPASAVAMKIFGPIGGTLVTIGIIISVIGAANGFLMSGSRVAFHLANTGTLPASRTLSKLNSKHVPTNSIILIGFLACVYSLIGQFNLLTDLAVFSCWIFYTLTFACVIKLRITQPNAERKYKVPLYPIIPALAIISGLYVVVSQLFLSGMKATIMSLCSIGITLLGLPVYLLVKKSNKK